MAGEVLPVVSRTPVLAGVNGTDPFRNMDVFLDQLKALGFSGVQNFPTVGLIDGTFRANLEETGMSYGLEIDMIAKARAKDMLTTPYVFSEDGSRGDGEGRRRHHRLPSRPHDRRLDRRADRAEAGGLPGARRRLGRGGAQRQSADVIVLVHGGPVAMPGDAEFIMKNTRNCHGFYGASSMERLPVEMALTEQTRKFKRDRSRRAAERPHETAREERPCQVN